MFTGEGNTALTALSSVISGVGDDAKVIAVAALGLLGIAIAIKLVPRIVKKFI